MSATFACPHCGATYPRKPVLVGRPVRCTTCKNAFKLREDGIADKIEMPDPAASAKPAVAPQAPAPVSAPVSAPRPTVVPLAIPPALTKAPPPAASTADRFSLDEEIEVVAPPVQAPAAPAPPPAKFPTPAGGNPARKSERLTSQQLDARRAMAATLANSMSAALKAESVKREAEGEEKKAKQTSGGKEGRVGKIGPAVFTGQGVEEARDRRMWWLAALAVLLVGAGLGFLVFDRSPQEEGLARFTAEVETYRIRKGERIAAIQERAWLTGIPPAQVGVPPVVIMSRPHFTAPRVVKLAGAKELFASLKGLTFVEQPPVWVPPDRVAAVRELWRPGTKMAAFMASNGIKREKRIVDHEDLLAKLVATGMTQEDAEAVSLLLRGQTSTNGENAIAKRLTAGDVPERFEISTFFGARGDLLVQRGQLFRTLDVHYKGQLLRFVGQGWPDDWRVLTLGTELIIKD
jgi:hypothetical protein